MLIREEKIERLKKLNNSITENCAKLSKNKIQIEIFEGQIEVIKSMLYKDICLMKSDDGKLKFSNEKLREAELKLQLNEDSNYLKLKESIKELKIENMQLIDVIESEKRLFRILRDEIKLLCREEVE